MPITVGLPFFSAVWYHYENKRGRVSVVKKTFVVVLAVAATAAFADFSEDTFAFYPLTDIAPGANGKNVQFKNAVDESSYAGTGIQWDHVNTYAKGVIVADEDAPGKYVFEDVSVAVPEPICTDPQSLHLSSRYEPGVDPSKDATPYANSGGEISFADVETKLSSCSEFTIEFFWKIDSDEGYQFEYDSALYLNQNQKNWLAYAGDSTVRRVGLAFPLVRDVTASNAKTLALFDGQNKWGNYCSYPAAITHDEWHHVGLVFKDGAFQVWGDYLNKSAELKGEKNESAGYVLTALEESVPLNFGHGVNGRPGFHGKVSCLRFSSKALAPEKFLRASNLPHYRNVREPDPVTMGNETIAYYSFREGAGKAGESAKDAYILNDIDAETHHGSVSVQATGGDLVYDDDIPGKYVFDTFKAGATACLTNPCSLRFVRSSQSGSILSAALQFENVATELSKSNELTIEFFYKMTEPTIVPGYAYNQVLTFNSGIIDAADEKRLSMGLWLPCGSPGDTPLQVRLSKAGSPSTYFVHSGTTYSNLADGKWHHVGITCVDTNFTMVLDYGKSSKAVANGVRQALDTSEPLKLGLDYFGGKISCLRVSKKALSPDEMLHVSARPTCKPADSLWYRFEDGTAGANLASAGAANTPRQYSDFAPSIFHWPTAFSAGDGYSAAGTVYPTFAGRSWWTTLRPTAGEDEMDNAKSLHFVTVPKASAGAVFASGTYVRSTSSALKGSMTMEAFVKFDYTAFMEHIGNVFSETCDRVSIMSHETGKTDSPWKLYMTSAKTKAVLNLGVWCVDDTKKDFSYTLPTATALRNKWHHYAVVYDEENLKISLYVDREKVIDESLPAKLIYNVEEKWRYYSFGSGGNNQPFDGWMDEIRLSEGVLGPDDFLRPDGRPGMILLFQ